MDYNVSVVGILTYHTLEDALNEEINEIEELKAVGELFNNIEETTVVENDNSTEILLNNNDPPIPGIHALSYNIFMCFYFIHFLIKIWSIYIYLYYLENCQNNNPQSEFFQIDLTYLNESFIDIEFISEAIQSDNFEIINESLLLELVDKRDALEIAEQEFIWYID